MIFIYTIFPWSLHNSRKLSLFSKVETLKELENGWEGVVSTWNNVLNLLLSSSLITKGKKERKYWGEREKILYKQMLYLGKSTTNILIKWLEVKILYLAQTHLYTMDLGGLEVLLDPVVDVQVNQYGIFTWVH